LRRNCRCALTTKRSSSLGSDHPQREIILGLGKELVVALDGPMLDREEACGGLLIEGDFVSTMGLEADIVGEPSIDAKMLGESDVHIETTRKNPRSKFTISSHQGSTPFRASFGLKPLRRC